MGGQTGRQTGRQTEGRQTDGRYQVRYLPASLSYAVDNELKFKPKQIVFYLRILL